MANCGDATNPRKLRRSGCWRERRSVREKQTRLRAEKARRTLRYSRAAYQTSERGRPAWFNPSVRFVSNVEGLWGNTTFEATNTRCSPLG